MTDILLPLFRLMDQWYDEHARTGLALLSFTLTQACSGLPIALIERCAGEILCAGLHLQWVYI